MRRERWQQAVVFNVGQGYVPIALTASGMATNLHLVDRDLLALRTSARNLQSDELNVGNCSLHNQVAWLPAPADQKDKFGLIVGKLRGDEPREAIEIGVDTIVGRLAANGSAVLAGGAGVRGVAGRPRGLLRVQPRPGPVVVDVALMPA